MKHGKWLMAVGMMLAMAGGAFADERSGRVFERGDHEWLGRGELHRGDHDDGGKAGAVSAPEIDPTSAVAAVMLAVGGILLIRARRRA